MRFRPRCGSIPSASTSSCGRPGRARIQHWRQGRARTEIARIASFVGVRTDRQHGCAVEGSTAARDNSVHFTVRAVGAIARLPVNGDQEPRLFGGEDAALHSRVLHAMVG